MDLSTGNVLGMHIGGVDGKNNYAALAWEFNRDPQWAWIWDGATRDARTAPDIAIAPGLADAVFSMKQLRRLKDLLVQHRMSDKTNVLFANPPEQMVAELSEAATPQDRLFAELASLNRKLYLISDELPIETILNTAETLSFDLQKTKALQPFQRTAEQLRAKIAEN